MNFAVNYSHQAAELVRQGKIQVDYFKCPAWQDLICTAQELCPVYVHFPLRVGKGINNAIDGETRQVADWRKMEQLLAQTQTPFLNLHLEPEAKDDPTIPVNSVHPDHIEIVTERMIRDVRAIVEQFGADRVIVENGSSIGDGLLRPGILPEVIHRVVYETGCGFLFDVSHARLSAIKLGVAVDDYIHALPIERTREIHITGLQRFEGKWKDLAHQANIDEATLQLFDGLLIDHLPMTDIDWEFLDWFVQQMKTNAFGKPWIASFEYGGVGWLFGAVTQTDVLFDQVPRLYQLFQNI